MSSQAKMTQACESKFSVAPRKGDAIVRENDIFAPFIYECDLFTKTGLGQT
eukprot:COSAG06_NODE_2548_length_6692_cov_35.291066_2_plen_51_part_00